MSNKLSTIYICSKCDAQTPKWAGRCGECGSWGTLTAETVETKDNAKKTPRVAPIKALDLGQLDNHKLERLPTGINEIDRVLGGGIVPGSLVLLGGEPGIGKSTLVAQIAGALNKRNKVVYVSGEESPGQIRSRLERLKIDLDSISFLPETGAEKIIASIEEIRPALAIIDSIQTVYSLEAEGELGGINQIKATAVKFLELAKKKNIAVILIGHITKDGSLAGPKSLEHIVDTVIYLETETTHDFRILRASKNRFGSTNELGILEMTGDGFREVKNPGSIFIEEGTDNLSGSCLSCIIEGTRPFLIEVQALVTKTAFGYPVRKASGFDLNRLQILCAVLQKRAKINLANQDVILNVVGGLRIADPALDLAVSMAIISSLSNQVFDRQTIALGEVGLGGEVRNVSRLEIRLAEAIKLGCKRALVPAGGVSNAKMKLETIKNVNDLVRFLTK
jgi:DNA repair protein RadA/Sms